jgi:hypothetical protein
VTLLGAAGLLVLVPVVLDRVVAGRTRQLQARIAAEQAAGAAAAEREAAAFQTYLARGACGTYTLDGPVLSRFIAARYGALVPQSVGAWRVVLDDASAVVEGVVDLQRYLGEMGMEQPASLSGYTGQEIPFRFRGRLEADHGQGRFTVDEVALLGLPLPLDLVERVAGPSGRGGGSVLIQRFTLPDGISSVRIEDRKLVINGDSRGP